MMRAPLLQEWRSRRVRAGSKARADSPPVLDKPGREFLECLAMTGKPA